MSNKITLFILVLLALMGTMGILIATQTGVGTTPDAIVYIGAARNFLNGNGLTIPFGEVIDGPMTHHAPLYSIFLAGIGIWGVDPLIGARWVNAIIIGCLIFLMGYWILKTTQGSAEIAILGSLLTLTGIPMLEIHAFAWSEPLFILFGFSGLALLAINLEKPAFLSSAISAGFIGLAVLTRYAGLAFVGTGVLSILIFQREKFSKKIIHAITYGVISTFPFVIWTLRNSLVAGTATSRMFALHPVTKTHLWQALQTLSGWLLLPSATPDILKAGLITLLGMGLIAMAVAHIKSTPATYDKKFPAFINIIIVFISFYSIFLILSISFFDANIPLDNRILSPLFFALLIVGLYFLNVFLEARQSQRIARFGIGLIAVIFSAAYLFYGINWIVNSAKTGLGFSSIAWQHSDFVTQMEKLPSETPIFTNAPHAVYILSGRSAKPLPKKSFATTQQNNDDYLSELSTIRAEIDEGTGFVIYFNIPHPDTQQAEKELVDYFPLVIISQAPEGTIYTSTLK